MPKVLDRAPREVHDVIAEVRRRWHGELDDAGVTIDAYMASLASETEKQAAQNAEKPALTLHGYPCAAIVEITPYKQRVKGVADAVITFDARRWAEMTDREKLALVDHEVTHLTLVHDREGALKSDQCGRPRLKMRLHDVETGWFLSVADRHKEHSAEVQQARTIHRQYGQLLFGFAWADDQAPADSPPDVSAIFRGADQEAGESTRPFDR